jgi:hypothetical protein
MGGRVFDVFRQISRARGVFGHVVLLVLVTACGPATVHELDMAAERDLAEPSVTPADLARRPEDLAEPRDLSRPRYDLATPRDMTRPDDLAVACVEPAPCGPTMPCPGDLSCWGPMNGPRYCYAVFTPCDCAHWCAPSFLTGCVHGVCD